MRTVVLVVAGAGMLAGCRATHRAAEASVDVATAPVRMVRHGFHRSENVQEQVYEGIPVPDQPMAAPRPRREYRPPVATETVNAPPERTVSDESNSNATARPSSTPRVVGSAPTAAPEFPVAKPVPGKPGFVYSPFDGTMIDVTGFSSGAKAKDPGNNKIFVVP